MNLNKELMGFRMAYLRAIAKSWNDKGFESQVVSDEGVCKNILDMSEFKKILQEEIEWTTSVAIVENPEVNYNAFNNESNNGWHGGADVMIVKIPSKPKGLREDELSIALSSYYSMFSTIFGSGETDHQGDMKDVKQVQDLFKSFKYSSKNELEAMVNDIHVDMGDGGVESFLSFGAAAMNIIANCWEDEAYFNHICSTVLEPVGQPGSVIKDMYMNFSNLWAFRIVFEKDNSAKWNLETQKWENCESNELYLQYPSKPDAEFSEAKALARYNTTGPAFPLSCF